MSDIKETLKDAGQKAVEAAKNVGHKIAEGASEAARRCEGKGRDRLRQQG